MKRAGETRQNILYTSFYGDMRGGGQWSLYYLVKHLNKDLFHPFVLCPEEGEVAERMSSVGAEVLFLRFGRIRHLNPLAFGKLISMIKRHDIHIVHVDSTTEAFYAGIAAKFMRVPLVWHIRVSDQSFLDRWLCSLSTKLILVANALTIRFPWLKDSNKVSVVHNAIDLLEFDSLPATSSVRKEFGIRESEILLACIGRIEERKGQAYLIDAMRSVENTKLVLLGQGEEKYLDRIRILCEKYQLSDRIILAGQRRDIVPILKQTDIVVFPSLAEGLSRAILETMAAKKPIVVTDVGGNAEAVVDGRVGYVVPAGDSLALAKRINELIGSKEKRSQMGQAGRKRVEEMFGIQDQINKVQKIYIDIVAGHL